MGPRRLISRLELLMAFAPLAILAMAGPIPGTLAVYRCTYVVDGDTIVLELPGGRRFCRLIGVDTPETVHPTKGVEYYGKEASGFLKGLVEGKDVRIGYDGRRPTYDKYHRRLVYVYLDGDPPLFVNREILARGYGHLYASHPFAFEEDFRAAEASARRGGRGLWARVGK